MATEAGFSNAFKFQPEVYCDLPLSNLLPETICKIFYMELKLFQKSVDNCTIYQLHQFRLIIHSHTGQNPPFSAYCFSPSENLDNLNNCKKRQLSKVVTDSTYWIPDSTPRILDSKANKRSDSGLPHMGRSI